MGLFDFFKNKKLNNNITEQSEPVIQEIKVTEESSFTESESNASLSALTEEQYIEFAHQAAEMVIKNTEIPCMGFTLENEPVSIFDSKVGGLPYLPQDAEIPIDKSGVQMKMLAQIDCSELKYLEEFPHQGILQFWLSPQWSWDEAKAVYYKEINCEVTEDYVKKKTNDFSENDKFAFPVDGEYKIKFTEGTSSMSCCDYRLKALFCQYFTELSGEYLSDPEDAECEEVYNIFVNECEERDEAFCGGHHLSGYRYSTQFGGWDYDDYERGTEINIHADDAEILLFQLDSDYGKLNFETRKHEYIKVMWGDAGVGRFNIKRNDLKSLNFDNTWFSWDCS